MIRNPEYVGRVAAEMTGFFGRGPGRKQHRPGPIGKAD
jgi:hypothetical protein